MCRFLFDGVCLVLISLIKFCMRPLKSCNSSGEATSVSCMFRSFMLVVGLLATKAGKLQIPLCASVKICCNYFLFIFAKLGAV